MLICVKKEPSPGLFKGRWTKKEGFLLAGTIWGVGLLYELFFGALPSIPPFPLNIILLALLAGITAALHTLHKQTELVKWHRSMEGALFSTGLFTCQILLLGFIPQQDKGSGFLSALGLSHIVSGWPFALSLMWMLLSLGLVIAGRIGKRLTLRNSGFLLNHGGLWIILVGMSVGSGDLMEMHLTAVRGVPVNHERGPQILNRLPFSVQLEDFQIEYHPPKIALFDPFEEGVPEIQKSFPFARENQTIRIKDWELTPIQVLTDVVPSKEGYIPSDSLEGGSAVYIRSKHRESGELSEGWAFSGSLLHESGSLFLGNNTQLSVFRPEPRKYRSVLTLMKSSGQRDSFQLEVNQPISYEGWKIYQSGYNTSMGSRSQTSVLYLIRDPWLPCIYLGIFMLFAGGLLMTWTGRPVMLNVEKTKE